MKISTRYTDDDWKKIDFQSEQGWQQAVTILEDRIRGRFFRPISLIENEDGAGFAVLALNCLLLETLQQFREGKSETPYKKNKEYFVKFLTETSFNEFFDKTLAMEFYDQIRNGILHQGEVKGSSLVTVRKDVPLVRRTSDCNGLEINRKHFNQRLQKVFDEYVVALRNPASDQLRKRFKDKMDFICRVAK